MRTTLCHDQALRPHTVRDAKICRLIRVARVALVENWRLQSWGLSCPSSLYGREQPEHVAEWSGTSLVTESCLESQKPAVLSHSTSFTLELGRKRQDLQASTSLDKRCLSAGHTVALNRKARSVEASPRSIGEFSLKDWGIQHNDLM